MKKVIALTLLNLYFIIAQSQNISISGMVVDINDNPLELVSVKLLNTVFGTTTNNDGSFSLTIPKQSGLLEIRRVGFETKIIEIPLGKSAYKINVKLNLSESQLNEIFVNDIKNRASNVVHIDPRLIGSLPNLAGGGVEAMVKTQPGVVSNNELTSQYSVRGGNFDENLVYINDIEVYRPLLIRSGQQEGLSVINPDMVSSIQFSAGGFDAKYDDKMSSVLDIKYKKPTEFNASFSASLLGATAHIEDISKNKKFSYIAGIRYKTSQYILNTLQTTGQYNPSFIDFQTYLTYRFSSTLECSFLANVSQNIFQFQPIDRSTTFGTMNNAINLKMYFDGNEYDKFSNLSGSFTLDYQPLPKLKIKNIVSAYQSTESETYDIEASYLLNEINTQVGTGAGDSSMNIGIGSSLDHARNYLTSSVYSVANKGYWSSGSNDFQWGLKYQYETINDQLNEWQLLDSAGYSIPYNSQSVNLYKTLVSSNSMESSRFISYIQDTYNLQIDSSQLIITGGLREHYWTYNKELLISPRFSISLKPSWAKDYVFRFHTGYYYQPAFYKELRNMDGTIYTNNKAQKSIHFVLGSDHTFTAWNRPFKWTAEVYYKKLDNLIPYEVDNVQIRYYADQLANGYATGFDFKINGDFVKGIDSWASLSIMQSREKIQGTDYGYIPLPTDQLVNVGIFFQDYLPMDKTYQMHLALFYGSGLPFNPPGQIQYRSNLRMPSYRRVDIGFSKVIVEDLYRPEKGKRFFKYFKSLIATAEIYNLLDVDNTVSYMWVKVVPTQVNPDLQAPSQYAVPNYLTARRINLKITAKF